LEKNAAIGAGEAVDGVLEVLVVGVPLLDIAAQPVDGEVQPGEAGGVGDALLAVDGDFRRGILLMRLPEAGELNEHAAEAARGIEDAAVIGLQSFHDQPDDRGGRVELMSASALTLRALLQKRPRRSAPFPALLPLAHSQRAEEVVRVLENGIGHERGTQ
jgi:hypothetical protein